MKSLLLAILLAASVPVLAATEVAGVTFADSAKVGPGETALNGAGMRNKLFLKVYALGLYLPQKAGNTADALAVKGAKRLAIVTLLDLTAEQFVDALVEGLKKNHDDVTFTALAPRIEQFRSIMLAIGNAPKKSVVHLDWLPESGTRLTFNGTQKGADIPGEDFYRALLRIWLGDKPAQNDLKDKLLGKAS